MSSAFRHFDKNAQFLNQNDFTHNVTELSNVHYKTMLSFLHAGGFLEYFHALLRNTSGDEDFHHLLRAHPER